MGKLRQRLVEVGVLDVQVGQQAAQTRRTRIAPHGVFQQRLRLPFFALQLQRCHEAGERDFGDIA